MQRRDHAAFIADFLTDFEGFLEIFKRGVIVSAGVVDLADIV